MWQLRRFRLRGLRLTALALAVCAAGGYCLRLAGAAIHSGPGAGVLGFTFVGAPPAAGQALLQWLGRADSGQALAPPATDAVGAAGQPTGQPVPQPSQPGQPSPQPDPAPAPGQTTPPAPNAPEQDLPSGATPSAPVPAVPDPAPVDSPADLPQGWQRVQTTFYPSIGEGERYIPLAAGSIRNLTSYTAAQVDAAAHDGGLPFDIQLDSDQPQVLIMHTHTTECYAEAEGMVSPTNNGRTTDNAANMAAVGAVLAQVLNDAGICTVQDVTQHDYPSYNGSYGRSRATVEKWLAAYPSIRIVLDVHRDAIENDGVRLAPTVDIGGRSAAQLMIICGADDGTMGMPNFWQNLRFAAALESAVEGAAPGLTRPVLFDYRNYNQQLTTGSLLLEFGTHGNTLPQAQYTAALVGQALADLLRGG